MKGNRKLWHDILAAVLAAVAATAAAHLAPMAVADHTVETGAAAGALRLAVARLGLY